MFNRRQIFLDSNENSLFFWGPRQTGKSTLLKELYPEAMRFDLLMTDVLHRFMAKPSLLREIVLADQRNEPIIIDEIQKVPPLLDEIHWLIENTPTRFILSGSSPRKILKAGVNLLGGRALRYELFPLSSMEIPDFDLTRALNVGLIPKHYLAKNPKNMLSAYVGAYLEDEIIAETKIRNTQVFTKFLEKAAFSNGEILNYTNIASDCGVSGPVIKEYFSILQDTLIGKTLEAYQKKPKRRVFSSPKFYFFDVGVANFLMKRKSIEVGSEAFGHAFEHFIFHELNCHSHYSNLDYKISYWRTTSMLEVDFILGENQVAIEVKSTDNIQSRHLKGLKAFSEEYSVKHKIVVSNDPFTRQVEDIKIMNWKVFLEKLWGGELIF